MKTKHIIIAIVTVAVLIGGAVVIFRSAEKEPPTNQNSNQNANANLNANIAANANTDNANSAANANASDPDIVTNQEVTVQGTVFVKGYKTPSESYGVLTSDNQEVGLGSYDSVREQFRIFVGDKVSVTFEKVCRSNRENCCRSLFFYCGTVKDYQSIE